MFSQMLSDGFLAGLMIGFVVAFVLAAIAIHRIADAMHKAGYKK